MIYTLKNKFSSLVARFINLDEIISNNCSRHVLAYHRILPYEKVQNEYIQDSMWTTPETFENQIKWMLKIGEIVDIERILDFERVNDKPLFSITFDDGWKDNFNYAFPVLRKYGINAVIFVVTAAVDTGRMFWPEEFQNKIYMALKNNKETQIRKYINDKLKIFLQKRNTCFLINSFLQSIKKMPIKERNENILDLYNTIGIETAPIIKNVLTWDEILEMNDYGIKFGSHTHTHVVLQYSDGEIIFDELAISKHILEKKIKKPVTMLSYPNAWYDISNAKIIEETGYQCSFRLHNLTVKEGYERYFIPRFLISEKYAAYPNYFKCKLLQIPRF